MEQPVEGQIAWVKVRGIVDLMDTSGCVLDFKTAAKRPNGISADHGLQLTTYAMISPVASGSCRLETVTKTKTILAQQTKSLVASGKEPPLSICGELVRAARSFGSVPVILPSAGIQDQEEDPKLDHDHPLKLELHRKLAVLSSRGV